MIENDLPDENFGFKHFYEAFQNQIFEELSVSGFVFDEVGQKFLLGHLHDAEKVAKMMRGEYV